MSIVLRRICGLCLFDVSGHRPKTNLWVVFFFLMWVGIVLRRIGGFVFLEVGGDHVSFWSLIVVIE